MFNKLIKIFKPKQTIKSINFSQLLNEYVDKIVSEDNLSAGTRRKYEHYIANINSFLIANNLQEILPEQIKPNHIIKLITWLHNNLKSCGKTHSARHAEICKRALNYAVVAEIIPYNATNSIITKRDRTKDIVACSVDEIILIMKTKYNNYLYTQVAHLFLFQCSTGISYADIYQYQYTVEADGTEWLYNKRKKTQRSYWVPVFPLTRVLITMYSGNLPVITNQTYNRVLKELAVILGINKHLTTHVARKTFATLMNEYGLSTKTISEMLGHSSVKTTETHYIHTNRQRIKTEINNLIYSNS